MDAKAYLDDHGINPDFVKKTFGWKWDDKRITIPYIENGKILFNRYRNFEGDSKFTADKGSHARLYCPTKIKKCDWLVFCEGEPDMVRLWQEGIPAITAGGVMSIGKLDVEVLRGKEIYLCLDNDEAGRGAVELYVNRLESVAEVVKVIELPGGVKDVCEFFASGKTSEDFQTLMIESEEFEPIEAYHIEEYKQLEFPKAQWLVKNLIRSDGFNLVVGQSGVGKSLLCLSIIKAVAEGKPWLNNEFVTSRKRVLIIDKENSDTDLQNNLKDMDIKGDVMIMKSAELFQFIDNEAELTSQAIKMKKFVERNGIDVVLLDSMIDFYVGSEDSSVDFNVNYQKWREVFGNRCILTIHHENKQPMKGKRNAKDRARGSTNIVAQANSIISVSSEETNPKLITVEHTKVRGARKHQPFQIEMLTKDVYQLGDSDIDTRSAVIGFEWVGEIDTDVRTKDAIQEAIVAMLARDPDEWYEAKEIVDEVVESGVGQRSMVASELKKLRDKGHITCTGEGKKGNPYLYKSNKNGSKQSYRKQVF